jgi:chromosomal replication initiation ATPase DnaA
MNNENNDFMIEVQQAKTNLEKYAESIIEQLKAKYPELELFFSVNLVDKTNHKMFIEDLIKETNLFFNVDITSKSRKSCYTKARFIFAYLCRNALGFSTPFIGDRLGGRDHSTIIASTNKFKDFFETEEPFREDTFKYIEHMKKLGYISIAYKLNYNEKYKFL